MEQHGPAFARAGLGSLAALRRLAQLPSDQLTVLLLVKLDVALTVSEEPERERRAHSPP